MIKEREKLEDALNLILQDYSNDKKIITNVTDDLMEKGIPRGKIGMIFSKSIPLSYISQVELCLFTKCLYSYTHEFKINPEHYFNELELSQSDQYQGASKEKTHRIVLHNVDQIDESLWLCTMETYQNIAKYFENGLLTYNPKTQRQPLKKKVGDRIIEVINIDPVKVNEIKDEMIKGSFNTTALIWNVRKIIGMPKPKYNRDNRTLTIEVTEGVFVDIADGMHRSGGILKSVEEKPEINLVTSIYVYNVTEEKALQVIRQQSKATNIDDEWIAINDSTNANMDVAKEINTRESKNIMVNRIGSKQEDLRKENKLLTFDTLSKTIEYIFDLKPDKFFEIPDVEDFLIDLFNVVVGINYEKFNDKLAETRKESYIADNNTFIGYISLGKSLKDKYPDSWQLELQKILKKLDFSKSGSTDWKKIGLENNINLSTIKKISEYFKTLTIS